MEKKRCDYCGQFLKETKPSDPNEGLFAIISRTSFFHKCPQIAKQMQQYLEETRIRPVFKIYTGSAGQRMLEEALEAEVKKIYPTFGEE